MPAHRINLSDIYSSGLSNFIFPQETDITVKMATEAGRTDEST